MRSYHPIVYDDRNSVWGILRYKDIKYVLTDHANFSSDFQKWRYPDQEIQPMLITSDPPAHKELHSQLSLVFTPSIIAKLEPRIEKITQEILNQVIENGHMDLITDLAYPLPLTIIAELLGVPPKDSNRYKSWIDKLLREVGGTVSNPVLEQNIQIQQQMNTYLHNIIKKRQEEPRNDLISDLLRVEEYNDDQLLILHLGQEFIRV